MLCLQVGHKVISLSEDSNLTVVYLISNQFAQKFASLQWQCNGQEGPIEFNAAE